MIRCTGRSQLVGFLLLAMAAGCQSQQSAMEIACNAPQQCEACRNADAASRSKLVSEYIFDNVSNSEVTKIFHALAAVDASERGALLQRAAQEAGVTVCPLANYYSIGADGSD